MNEYPTEKELKDIEEWPLSTYNDYIDFAKHICIMWHWEDWATLKGRTLRLATGGWSGNEDLLSAIRKNFMFHSRCWESSHKGGLVIYKLPIKKDFK